VSAWLGYLGGAIAVLLVGVLIYASTRPDSFRVERSATIAATPDKVFAHLVDFKAWGAWSPWDKKDPAMKRSFGATTSGKGATYAWEGNKQVGKGSMEILESAAPSRLVIKLDFLAPFEAHNTAEFTLASRDGGTTITWAMHGPSSFASKLMSLLFNMDKMVGGDFETGLASLKGLAER